jgi:hypothetical protein
VTARTQATRTTRDGITTDVAKRRVLLQIATARYDIAPVLIRVVSEEPQPDLAADHVVDADLQVQSGNLVLLSVTDDWEDLRPTD